MDDKPTNEEPKKEFNKLDLSQLEGFSFGTEWTKDQTQSDSAPRRREDRPRREGPRDDRRDRRGFKRPADAGGGAGDGGTRDRRPEGGGPRGQPGSGGRRPSGPRGESRDERHHEAAQGPYISPYFEATFYPEDVSFAALAKTIRASARTFELFDIAKTVIGKNDRFVVVLDRKANRDTSPETAKPFFVSLLDGIPFETEEAAMNHIVQRHLPRFFEISEVEAEPPKGSFQVINKCGVTGELLGPPNYHLYSQIVQQHHATRLARMDFERFSSRIESVRDPEVVEQWLESMKRVTRYTWRGDENVPVKENAVTAPEPAEKEAAAPAPVDDPAPVVESAPAEVAGDAMAASPEPAATTDEAAAVETTDESAPVAAAAAASTETATEAAEESTAPAAVAAQPTFDSATEAKVHLITRARDKCVRTYAQGRFHGRALDEMPDGEIKRAVLGALDRQRRFPLDTANALRGRLRREGFTIFKKGAKGVSYVSAVKRKFRVAGQTFADSINNLITFIEQHPMVKVSQLTEKFLGVAPVSTPDSPETPSSTAPGTTSPFGEVDQPRIRRMHGDLRWLVTEGYVTEFMDGSLFAAPPMPPAKPKHPPPPPTPEVVAAETPESVAQVPEAGPPAESPVSPPSAPAEEAPAKPTPAAEEATPAATTESAPIPEPAPQTDAPEPARDESETEAADTKSSG